jgi:hypothetical protein
MSFSPVLGSTTILYKETYIEESVKIKTAKIGRFAEFVHLLLPTGLSGAYARIQFQGIDRRPKNEIRIDAIGITADAYQNLGVFHRLFQLVLEVGFNNGCEGRTNFKAMKLDIAWAYECGMRADDDEINRKIVQNFGNEQFFSSNALRAVNMRLPSEEIEKWAKIITLNPLLTKECTSEIKILS